MAYNNTPLANQRIKDTQEPIRENFESIQTAFSVNHIAIQNPTNEGKHRVVTMPEWAMPPEATTDPVTLPDEMALYTKESSNTNVSELYLRRENNGSIIPLSESNLASPGWTYLPSGVLVKWLSTSVPLVGNNTVQLSNSPTTFSTLLHVQLTLAGVGGSGPGFVYTNGSNLGASPQTITVNCSVSNLLVWMLVMGIPT